MAWSCGSLSNIRGVDVSAAYQGSPIGTESYWDSLKTDGYAFGFIQATDGISITNQYLSGAWSGCNAVNGLDRTYLYHFLEWGDGGEAQADHFWSVISALKNPTFDGYKTVLAVDVEGATLESQITIVNDFINRMFTLGANPANFVVYTNESTWNTLGNPTTWDYLALWLAAGNGRTWCPDYTFGGWPNWSYMQYGTETLLGVPTDVDEING